MVRVPRLAPYSDDSSNTIDYDGLIEKGIQIKFTGSNNRVVIHRNARIGSLTVDLDCDNGYLEIGRSSGVPAFSASIRVGQDSRVVIGNNVSTTTAVAMSATEGTAITVGDDVMFASENQVRADDGHPIFDVQTGARVNVSKSIAIGAHVWLGRSAVVLGGARIGDGSVIGYGSIVTRPIPNNCIAAGVPAKVLRRHVAWERPHLSLVKPYYKPDATTVTKSEDYWRLTEEAPTVQRRSTLARLARLAPARLVRLAPARLVRLAKARLT
jgi:acetyltransferase-like isoleucine patch superfamily enzyme